MSRPALIFGHPNCPPGAIQQQGIPVCSYLNTLAVTVIEIHSLSRPNAWTFEWVCEPDPAKSRTFPWPQDPDIGPTGGTSWMVLHRDVMLVVFPTGVDVMLYANEKRTDIASGTTIGKLIFTPGGEAVYKLRNLSVAVAQAFVIFEILFSCMDEARARGLDLPVYFLGDSMDQRMVAFACRHLGFEAIDNGIAGTLIYARVDTVRKRVFADRNRLERLAMRAAREQARRRHKA